MLRELAVNPTVEADTLEMYSNAADDPVHGVPTASELPGDLGDGLAVGEQAADGLFLGGQTIDSFSHVHRQLLLRDWFGKRASKRQFDYEAGPIDEDVEDEVTTNFRTGLR